ncbi:MAG: 2-oxoglutarate dehydrogenase complex dihydrolipoyllysine-residue succinyltransferase [Polyangiaceae bacterium]|nr:2-oxoglutarate dehydrogenase complex dihydrolipoyllysine-residue succinyltransferase [Polyangiaceae bacterium]
MPVELKVPSVGESITEVQIGEWLKAVGDHVKKEEVLVMIETDKVTVELPAPIAGVLSEIRVTNGQAASVGDVIGTIEEATMVAEAPPARAVPGAAARSEARPTPVAAEPATVERAPQSVRPESVPPEGFARVMPAARRALAESGLDPTDVIPTGPGGRLLKEDVLRARASEPPPPPAPEPPAPPAPPPPLAPPAAPLAPSAVASGGAREEEVVAMTPMRRRIAERLVESLQTSAQLTTFNEVDMSAVFALRKEFQERFQAKYKIKLGLVSFFVKAAIEALKQVPEVNAEIRGTDVIYKNYYDIGVAVGGGKGLVVPIIRNAERLSFAETELAIADYGKRAQEGKLKLEELQGGTFTLSNGGVYGNLLSTPIINPPQSAILGLHAIQDRAVVREGQIVIRPMMYVAVSYDHRIIDGREAVGFLKRIKECVEEPTRILLEV